MSVGETKQGKETQLKLPIKYYDEERFNWVETSVWTDKMLTALERGLKGDKWFSLIDKVCSERNLKASWERVKRNGGSAGIDKQTIERFEAKAEIYLQEIREALKTDGYMPDKIKRVWIPKVGKAEMRPLGIPVIKDRITQTALRNVIEPIFETKFYEHSYGFRPKRGCKDALRRIDELMKIGYLYIVEFDIKAYFDNVDKDILLNKIQERIADNRIIELLEKYLEQTIVDEMKEWKPESGTPQGAVISPLLANIYLDEFDRYFANNGKELIRYADDGVILCKTKKEAEECLEMIKEKLKKLKLEIHPEKSKIVDMNKEEAEFEFLGYKFYREKKRAIISRYPATKSFNKMKDRVRTLTQRQNGASIEKVIADTNKTMKGWYEYFKHCNKFIFEKVDGWIRRRLRRILRKRDGREGNSIGADHQRYPNAFFAKLGFFSLKETHTLACQS